MEHTLTIICKEPPREELHAEITRLCAIYKVFWYGSGYHFGKSPLGPIKYKAEISAAHYCDLLDFQNKLFELWKPKQ